MVKVKGKAVPVTGREEYSDKKVNIEECSPLSNPFGYLF
jgi:hypothetical protein